LLIFLVTYLLKIIMYVIVIVCNISVLRHSVVNYCRPCVACCKDSATY